jgi:hypothetical protein
MAVVTREQWLVVSLKQLYRLWLEWLLRCQDHLLQFILQAQAKDTNRNLMTL